jgi:hypothetical protein
LEELDGPCDVHDFRISAFRRRAALQRRVTDAERPELSKAFAGWLLGNTEREGEFSSLVTAAAKRECALQDFPTVAILGFGAASGILGVEQMAAFRKGLRRQVGREVVIDEVPAAFCTDAVGILGIVLGTKAVADTELTSEVVKWLSKFLKNSYEGRCAEDWQRCLFAVADRQLGSPLGLSVPQSPAAADARMALTSKGVIEASTEEPSDQDVYLVLALTLRELPHDLSYDQAALRLAALKAVVETVVPVVGRNVISRLPKGRRSLSSRDQRLHKGIGAERFRTLTNAEIMKEASPKKLLRVEGLDRRSDAAKRCLDRIRKAEGYPLSRDITKKRTHPA